MGLGFTQELYVLEFNYGIIFPLSISIRVVTRNWFHRLLVLWCRKLGMGPRVYNISFHVHSGIALTKDTVIAPNSLREVKMGVLEFPFNSQSVSQSVTFC